MSPHRGTRAPGRWSGQGILLCGLRPEAVKTARKMGLRVALLAESPRKRPPDYPWAMIGPDDEATAQAVRQLSLQVPIRGVLALTEAGVQAACIARQVLDLPGPRIPAPLVHKAAMKAAIRKAGITCADWIQLDEDSDATEVADDLGLPLVIKRPTGGGGKNLVIARDLATVAEAIQPGWVAESFVRGLELSVETISVAGEVRFRNFTRYVEPRWVNLVPSTLATKVRKGIADLTDRALAALGIRDGISHLEVFLSEDGPVFGEIAARPPGGRIMDLIELAYGFDPWEALLAIALGGRPRLPRRPKRFAAACFIHPGQGRVRAIHGIPESQALDGVIWARARVEVGDILSPRIGVAERAAEIVAIGDDVETCLHRLGDARRQVRFDLERIDEKA